jgi:putative ABC transport system permease protein
VVAVGLIRLSPWIETLMTPKLQFQVGFGAMPDMRVVVFTMAVAMIAVALFGLAPALKSSATRSLSGLIGAPRTAAGRPQRLRGILVVTQLAMSVVLLVGATHFARSLALARSADVGFDPRNRAVLSVNVGLQGYDEARGRRFYDEVVARTRALPAVISAAWGFPVPFDTYGRGMSLYVEGVSTRNEDGTVGIEVSHVGEDFVSALGLHLIAGRVPTIADSVGAPRVMVLSRQLASRLWPGKEPVGRRARIGGAEGPEITVVGVVADAKFANIGGTGEARAFIPLRQRYRDWQTLIVHTRGDPVSAAPELRRVVASVDPMLPVFGVSTMTAAVESGLSTSRTAASIAGFFGVIALVISSIGLYAVVASGVSERTREIGVRMALGSSPADVMKFVMRGGAQLGLIGLVAGLAGAGVVARLMAGLLVGLSPADPMTFAIVPMILMLVVLVATCIPALRAVRLDPVKALRSE